jgi:capsular exopolysaccharide synthesis family protein
MSEADTHSEQAPARGTGATSVVRRRSPGYYYGRAPYYSGHPGVYGGQAGPGGSYAYGSYYNQPGQGVSDDEESLVGAITLGRMLRVCQQRWITILVFCILGAAGAFAFYKIAPTVYQAVSLFEMNVRPGRIMKWGPVVNNSGMAAEATGNMDEIFNTRLARMRSRAMIEMTMAHYRMEHPGSQALDSDIISALVQGTEMTLQRRSRIVRIAVRSTDRQLAADLANAYAGAAETFAQEDNKAESDNAVEWLKTTVDAQRRLVERADQAILDFRVANQIDAMVNEKESVGRAFDKVNSDLITMELEILRAAELMKTLETVQNDPGQYGAFPEAMPRTLEIAQAYQKLQETMAERNAMLAKFTAKHPDVLVQEKVVDVYRKQFAEVVWRARETVAANLALLRRQYEPIKARRDNLEKSYAELQIKIDSASARLAQLQRDQEINDITHKALLTRMEEARIVADENTAVIKIVEKCEPPKTPISPNPFVIFPAGPMLGMLLGVLFVLILDHLEDKITSISDVEQRLHTKVLCVLPHVRRKKREGLALVVAEDKFAQFAEALAGLRNLLDAPRYRDSSKVLLVMSTQPSEGKTVTSSNLALSYASGGQKTLLVDFDMRRPRQAHIYKKSNKEYQSLPHTLAKGDPSLFAALPIASGYANLDIVLSRPSSEISPANLMGTGAVADFFNWARQNYDRVIIDSPPFGIVGDTVVLSTLCDSVMIMCCPDRSHFRPLKHAIRHLTEAGAHVTGVLVNDVDFGRRSMFSGYDYHYRYAYQYSGKYGANDGTGKAGEGMAVQPESRHELADDEVVPVKTDVRNAAGVDADDDDL